MVTVPVKSGKNFTLNMLLHDRRIAYVLYSKDIDKALLLKVGCVDVVGALLESIETQGPSDPDATLEILWHRLGASRPAH